MIDFSKQKLLIIAPHPDDEVLGCGGLIKKIKDAGGKVYVLFLTVGTTVEYAAHGSTTADDRVREIESVAGYLNFDDYRIAFHGDQYHLRLDTIAQKDLMYEIENGQKISLNSLQPTIVATPPSHDYNQDHRAATNAVFAACRPAPDDTKPYQKIVLGYESVPTAEWASDNSRNPNFLVSLTDAELDAKVHALELYKTQVRQGAHPRSLQSVRTLAHYRGIMCGAKAAEAYFSYRIAL